MNCHMKGCTTRAERVVMVVGVRGEIELCHSHAQALVHGELIPDPRGTYLEGKADGYTEGHLDGMNRMVRDLAELVPVGDDDPRQRDSAVTLLSVYLDKVSGDHPMPKTPPNDVEHAALVALIGELT